MDLDPEYPVDALRISDLEVVFRSEVEKENHQPHLLAIPGLLEGLPVCFRFCSAEQF